jgi:hypothetical protein
MDDYWDSEDQWLEESRCLVCKANIGLSDLFVCSATCEDLLALRVTRASQLI